MSIDPSLTYREQCLVIRRVPRTDFVRLARMIDQAVELSDVPTLEVCIDYLGSLAHADRIAKQSRLTALALYYRTMESWACITQVVA